MNFLNDRSTALSDEDTRLDRGDWRNNRCTDDEELSREYLYSPSTPKLQQPSPARKLHPFARRGARLHASLLKSAVMASIESIDSTGEDKPIAIVVPPRYERNSRCNPLKRVRDDEDEHILKEAMDLFDSIKIQCQGQSKRKISRK